MATVARMVDQAMLVERRRIARDVHDLVGHSLSVVMLHVAGARHLVRSDRDEAERALAQAEEAGRESMAELRRRIGLLRDDDDSGETMPSPTASDIANIVGQYRGPGLDVSYHVDGPIDDVEGSTAVACYRIAQEDLIRATLIVAGDGAWLDPAVTPRVLAQRRHNVGPSSLARPAAELTERENDVLLLIACGRTNTEIAEELRLPARSRSPVVAVTDVAAPRISDALPTGTEGIDQPVGGRQDRDGSLPSEA